MDYVALLRARNVLRITAIIFGAYILCNVILRLIVPMHVTATGNTVGFGFSSHATPGTIVTHETLPSGVKRTIVTEPAKHRRFVIDDRGYFGATVIKQRPAHQGGGLHQSTHASKLRLRGPLAAAPRGFTAQRSIHAPMFALKAYTQDGVHTTILHIGAPTDLAFLFGFAVIVGLILATILSGALAAENDGHLELAFARPHPREILALRIVATDILAIIAGELLTVVAFILTIAVYMFPYLAVSSYTLVVVLGSMLLPIAWYAMLLAASARLRRGHGIVSGIAWPFAIAVPIIAVATTGAKVLVWQVFHAVTVPLSRLDPLWYAQAILPNQGHMTQLESAPWNQAAGAALLALAILSVIYFAVAVLQWRRMEA
ncbi:MAG: hypothetical protein ACYDA5_06905 [Vulcanimicrobiaceae bacterium]